MVIVNVLINERGEVLAARILQGLAGESSETKDTDEACLEAAKRVVFDPARSKEGRRVKVWQAVGFYLD
jgi:TonB family protein